MQRLKEHRSCGNDIASNVQLTLSYVGCATIEQFLSTFFLCLSTCLLLYDLASIVRHVHFTRLTLGLQSHLGRLLGCSEVSYRALQSES